MLLLLQRLGRDVDQERLGFVRIGRGNVARGHVLTGGKSASLQYQTGEQSDN
jgi:hypothetical protein